MKLSTSSEVELQGVRIAQERPKNTGQEMV